MRMHIDMYLSGVNKIWKERMKIQQAFTLYVANRTDVIFTGRV